MLPKLDNCPTSIDEGRVANGLGSVPGQIESSPGLHPAPDDPALDSGGHSAEIRDHELAILDVPRFRHRSLVLKRQVVCPGNFGESGDRRAGAGMDTFKDWQHIVTNGVPRLVAVCICRVDQVRETPRLDQIEHVLPRLEQQRPNHSELSSSVLPRPVLDRRHSSDALESTPTDEV
jgi:hypothetical protein